MKVNILAIGVHPDDIELWCSGTLLKHIELWYTVALCDLTQWELGTRWSAETRLAEADKAQKLIGAVARENLNMADGYFQHTPENIHKIIEVIRKYQPDIVLANAITDRHPDHGRAAKLIADACFYAGLRKIDTNQEARRPKAVYHYIQDQNLPADFVIDISPYIDKKQEIILAFESQFYNPDSNEPETPISSQNFLESVKGKNSSYGRSINVAYGEWFTVNRTMGVQDLYDLI